MQERYRQSWQSTNPETVEQEADRVDMAWKMIQEGNTRAYEHFKELNPDATPLTTINYSDFRTWASMICLIGNDAWQTSKRSGEIFPAHSPRKTLIK
jgi:hypothetical protein